MRVLATGASNFDRALWLTLPVLVLIWIVRVPLKYRRRFMNVAAKVRQRESRSDTDFLTACGVTEDAQDRLVASTVREFVADRMTVGRTQVYPADQTADSDFRMLFFDSLDWLDLIFRAEKAADTKIARKCLEEAMRREIGERATFSVRDLVRASIVATRAGTKISRKVVSLGRSAHD